MTHEAISACISQIRIRQAQEDAVRGTLGAGGVEGSNQVLIANCLFELELKLLSAPYHNR